VLFSNKKLYGVIMKISEILNKKEFIVSFEFFPPKKEENEHILFETIEKLKPFNPDFVSITYGAGGSTRDKTAYWTKLIKKDFDINVMMHLTCIAATKSDIDANLSMLEQEGIENILALRGDPPRDFPEDKIKKEFRYAYELVSFIKNRGDFSVGVAGYPEGHIESENLEKDIEHLKQKVDCGADFVVTQLFFDNTYFYDFLDRAAKYNINVPIIPGIMPITNINQVIKFTEMCGATVPETLIKEMIDKSEEDMFKIGVEYAIKQCIDLKKNGVRGLHFYTLNKSEATKLVLEGLL
jgi:methylenetetrahydrofolate reductase (NADPH)